MKRVLGDRFRINISSNATSFLKRVMRFFSCTIKSFILRKIKYFLAEEKVLSRGQKKHPLTTPIISGVLFYLQSMPF